MQGNVAAILMCHFVVKDELESAALVEVARVAGLQEVFYAITLRGRLPNSVLTGLLQGKHDQPD